MFSNKKDTRERVLLAAAEVFGKHGYRAATVRQICTLAGTGVAAVNYYYASKEQLYLAVLESLMREAFEKFPVDQGLGENPAPEEKLSAFIKGTLLRVIGEEGIFKGKVHGRLIALEISNPSPILDQLVEKYIKPQSLILMDIVRKLLGPRANPGTVKFCALSIIGQCFHYAFANPIIEQLEIVDLQDWTIIDQIADHIFKFSLGGINRTREGLERS